MALQTYHNTRHHEIHMRLIVNGQLVTATVPPAKIDPADSNNVIKGEALLDAEFVEKARKEKGVIGFYFNEGWLKPAIALEPVSRPRK